jgi:hypothetical protein
VCAHAGLLGKVNQTKGVERPLASEINQLVKTISAKLITSRGLTTAVGTTGSMGSKIRNNLVFEALLRRRVSNDGEELSTTDVCNIRESTLSFVEKMRIKTGNFGCFTYSVSCKEPLLYASIYACLTRYLYRDLGGLSEKNRQDWINYIQNGQAEDGLFKDPAVKNQLAETEDWWGWRHLTLHAIMALTALNATAKRRFIFLDKFRSNGSMAKWIQSRNWLENPANVSNEIQNCGALLQYARDFHGQQWTNDALNELFESLDRLQDSQTGLWVNRFDTSALLSVGVQTGYHIWLLYFYDHRPIRNKERIIDNCLKTQNKLGGFGPFLNSSACEDIDSIDPLARLFFLTSHRRTTIQCVMQHALAWIFAGMNKDGGFVFRRNEPFVYGHEKMFSGVNESALFPTWFRTLSLAYLSKVLPESNVGRFDWQFLKCPGYQFWN